jgi:hypothetical protein
MKGFLDSFGYSGAITFIFSIFTLIGIIMSACGNPAGKEIWTTFSTALTTFVSGKIITKMETRDKDSGNIVTKMESKEKE